MMDKRKLMSLMALNGRTQEDLAKQLGLSLSRVNAKINENNAQFTQNEIMSIKNIFSLDAEQVNSIFFAKQVS